MEILKAFIQDDKQYNITILWENEESLFKASEIGDLLDIKKIYSSITDYDKDEKVIRNINTNGGNQDVVFLTEEGLYKLIMQSRKPIVKSFQKWVTKVIKEIRKTGKYELELINNNQLEIEKALKLEGDKMQNIIEINQHNALVEAFRDRYVVYIAKIKDIDNKILIKIGSTKELQNIVKTLIKEYNTFNVVKIFECPRNEAFEKFLHKHPNIIKYKYNINNSNELFLVTNDELNKVIEIGIHNKFKFSSVADNEQIIEIENIKLKQIIEQNKHISLKDNQDIKYIDPIILLHDSRKHTQIRGNKIQCYTKDSKTLVKTYESYAYALRDKELFEDMTISRISIKNAIDNKLIYKNYRWAELNRSLDDNTIQDIGDTVISKQVKLGYVAMLNLDKNKIVQVFPDQKAAQEDRKFTSSASIANAIKRQSISSGHYFNMWHDCDDTLKEKYLENNELPNKRVAVNGKEVIQLHPINNNELQSFTSCEDIIKKYKISRKTLYSAIENDIICKGYKWKYK